MGAGSGSTTLGIRSGDAAVSKRPRPRSRSLPIKRTRCQYRHHLRAAASIIASTASFIRCQCEMQRGTPPGAGAVLSSARSTTRCGNEGLRVRVARSHEDERIATCAVVALKYIPQRATACMGRGGEDQRTTGRRQADSTAVRISTSGLAQTARGFPGRFESVGFPRG